MFRIEGTPDEIQHAMQLICEKAGIVSTVQLCAIWTCVTECLIVPICQCLQVRNVADIIRTMIPYSNFSP